MTNKMLLYLFLFCCVLEVYSKEPCILYLRDSEKTPIFRPFVYDQEDKLFATKNDQIRLLHDSSVLLSCQNNYFRKYPTAHQLKVSCVDDSLIVDHDKSGNRFKDLNCDLRVMEEVKYSVAGCVEPNTGLLYQYYDGPKSSYIKMAEVCYDYQKDQNVFVKSQLLRSNAGELQAQNKTLLSDMGTVHRVALLPAYRPMNMEKSLKRLLGEESDMQQPLTAARLLPKLFFNEQYQDMEKFPTNLVPLWKSVEEGNWKRTLQDIKDLSTDRDLDVVLGTHQVLSLPKPDGKDAALYLNANKIPIPKYVWAAVQDRNTRQAVAIVTVNNPFVTYDEMKSSMFCESECDKVTWLRSLTKNGNHGRGIFGFTFCCKMSNFKLYPAITTAELLKK